MKITGKTKKRLSLLLVCAMLAGLLSGCYEGIDTTIHADGSGTLTVRYGFTEEELKMLSEEDSLDVETFEVDGVTYYGEIEETDFASVEEFNALMSDSGGQAVILLEEENGGLTLTVDGQPREYEYDPDYEWDEETFEWTEERIAERTKEYLACFRARATGGFSDYDLRTAAAHLAKKSADYSDAEFAYVIDYWSNDATVEWLNSYLWDVLDDIRNYPEYIHYPLTTKQRDARRATIKATLNALSIELTEEDKTFYTDAMCDWYDEYYTDAEFEEEMAQLRAMNQAELREELSYFGWRYDRPLSEEKRAERRAAIEELLDGLAVELNEEDRAFYTDAMCDWYDEWFTDAEFAAAMEQLRALSATEQRDWLDYLADYYDRPLTEAQRAERRAAIEATLNALSIELTEEDKAFYTDAMCDWYDEYYTDAEFVGEMAKLRAMEPAELREELDYFDWRYDRSSSSMEDMLADATMIWTIRFDSAVTQIAGPADGVRVEGNTVTINMAEMAEDLYRFTTRTDLGWAYEREQTVEVDGVPVTLSCYATRTGSYETNYVRIRELAAALKGTAAQFDVGWDDAVVIRTGTAYSGGGEAVAPFSGKQLCTVGGFETRVDGTPAELDAITLNDANGNGYTYYKLRDLGQALDFNVRWDGERGIVCIDTDKPYSAED